MKYGLNDELNERLEFLSGINSKIKEKIDNYPGGRIRIKKSKNGLYFYQSVGGSHEKYIRKNDLNTVQRMIQRDYLEKVYKISQHEDDVIRRFIRDYPELILEKVIDTIPDERKKFINPIVIPDEQYVRLWMDVPYTPKGFAKDVPFFITKKGERVRSKSEMIIADKLLDNGIPYKYECPVVVGDNEIIHPDFTILRVRDRKIIYHEHCGKMSDPGYVEDMMERSIKYSLAGIILGDRLFYTFESSKTPLDVRVLDNMIRCNFM